MLTYVLGGSGKSAVASLLRESLRTEVVVDWEALMAAASELAGRDVRRSPTTWPGYDRLVRAVVEAVMPSPLVVLGVRTPDELEDWPIDAWVLLDCSDTNAGAGSAHAVTQQRSRRRWRAPVTTGSSGCRSSTQPAVHRMTSRPAR
jgi:hypothetical protein